MKKFTILRSFAIVAGMMLAMSGWGQTSTQDFGTGTGSHTSQTGSNSFIPNPVSGTTWARAGATAPNAPIVLATASNPLGTSGTYVRAVASASTSVSKFSPWVGYTGSTEFYTSFKILFGDASAGSTATSGNWTFYQGAGAMYSDAADFAGAQVFTGLRFTFGVGGVLALSYRGGSSWTNAGLSPNSLSSATIYSIEIVGNNKASGTINYTYNGISESVAVQKFDLYVNGTKIGDDLSRAALAAGSNITSGTFIGISSTSNAANVFVDDVVVYNSVPAEIGSSNTPLITVAPTTLSGFTYVLGSGPSTSQSFELSGTNLDGSNVILNAPANFEISEEENGTFSSSITLTAFDGTASDIWVRLVDGLSADVYSGNISITGGGADSISVAVSGEVTEPPPPPPGLPYAEDFSGFISAETLPDGWALDGTYAYGGDFGTGTSGGLRGNGVLGFQLTGSVPNDNFTATLTLDNTTGSTITELLIQYTGKVARVEQTGTPKWVVSINGTVYPELEYSTEDGVEKNVFYFITGLSISDGALIEIEWFTTSTGTSGTRRQIGIDDVSVTVPAYYFLIGAADDASNYATWSNNDNAGYGFGPWTFTTDGNAGFFLGDPVSAGISGMDNPSFGLYANPAGNNFADADRAFISPLGVGSTFSVVWGVNWDSDGSGNKGINLFAGGTSGTQIININMGGSAAITINGNPMFNNYGTNAMTLNFEYVSEGQLRVYGTGRDGFESYDQTISVAAAPDAVRFYASGLAPGDNRQPYFNNLKIETDPSGIPNDATVIVKGQPNLNQGIVIENLIIEAGNALTIGLTSAVTVNGLLTNDAGATGLVIKSDATGTGSLIHNTASVTATMERFMNNADWTNWKDGWHFLGSPVENQAISPAFTTAPYDFYLWNEPTNEWVNFKNQSGGGGTTPFFDVVNGSNNFTLGRGYMAAYDDGGVKSFSGALNVTDVPKTGLGISGGNNESWHLLGNPFSSALTWDASAAWGLTNIAGVAKIWNEANQSYSDLTSSPSTVIPATNGFMVQVSTGTASLTIPAAKRVHSSQPFYKSTATGMMLTARSHTAGNAQEARIVINTDATNGFDLMYDSEFLAGHAPEFYSFAGEIKLSTNSLPELSAETEIPFNFVKNEGNQFSIEASGIENISAIPYLVDLKTGTNQNLTENPVYNFTSQDGDAPGRFLLKFSAVGIPEVPGSESLQAWVYGNILYVMNSGASTARVEVYNIHGQLLMARETAQGLQSLPVNIPPGTYLVKMTSEGATATRKISIQ
jgi:hypothetical protein